MDGQHAAVSATLCIMAGQRRHKRHNHCLAALCGLPVLQARVPQIREHLLVEAEGTLRVLTPWLLLRQGVRMAILCGQKPVDDRRVAFVEDLLDEAADDRLVLLRCHRLLLVPQPAPTHARRYDSTPSRCRSRHVIFEARGVALSVSCDVKILQRVSSHPKTNGHKVTTTVPGVETSARQPPARATAHRTNRRPIIPGGVIHWPQPYGRGVSN